MSRDNDGFFGRGQTYFGGGTANATDGAHLLGQTRVFEDIDWGGTAGGMKTARTNRKVVCMAVRNTSGSTLLPKRVAKMKTDGSGYQYLSEVMGYATSAGEVGYPIDEFLPAAGVVANDIFWVVVQGPAKVTTGASGDTNISIGAYVVPTTDGKVVDQVVAEDDADIFPQIQGGVGRAVQAVNAINTDFLINVGGVNNVPA